MVNQPPIQLENKVINKDSIEVIVRSANEVLFSGSARAISSYNEKGLFDVLPLHAQFISIIKKKLVIHEYENQKKEFTIDTGIIQVKNNVIQIFLGFEPIEL